MKKWLISLYISPSSIGYVFLIFLQKYWWGVYGVLCLVIISYPLYQSISYSHNIVINQQALDQLEQDIQREEKRLLALNKHYVKNIDQDKNVADLHHTINEIIIRNNAKIEQVQWYVNRNLEVQINVQQKSKLILNLIRDLNQVENLSFKEITIIRLNNHHLVQLDAILVVAD
ncbi:hypothetical protein EV693_102282 [Nicoletella semolina]|uniref:Uncharacterized protein n=1 Tax=Nicoletella semolina TaxID=271160 RepID=A0A4R2NC68_9PAST|nr:hypothetical protein [Nicoletella semolina]MDH2925052.1 hypothetical protein [Nicoletella semolina]TCP18602.1 hypothetical protein EV693_102282 [Nicoletella semolina]